MKFPTVLVALCLSAVTAHASVGHGSGALASRHHHAALVSRKEDTPLEKTARRRCRARDPSSTPTAEAPKKTEEPKPKPKPENPNNGGGGSGGGKTTTAGGGACGGPNAQSKPSRDSGPNGNINYLNCGIDGGGWNPPNINMGNVVYKSLDEALAMPDSPFKNCGEYIHLFNRFAGETGVPAIMLASIAMQESSCRPWTVGDGGEQGLMQITRDKCEGRSDEACRNPEFNIGTGARYLAGRVKAADGNLVLAAGGYNGWYRKLTKEAATRARWSKCCKCQNNLDYIHQLFNGWMQGVDAYKHNMRVYNNLADCS